MPRFPATRWSLIVRVGADNPAGRRALEELCQAYWPALYAFLRARGFPPEEAEEMVQGFFAGFVDRGGFARADPNRGRLRTFLLASLRHHLAHQRERAGAVKRGAIVTELVETAQIEAMVGGAEVQDPEQVFVSAWAQRVLDVTLSELRADYERRDKRAVFDALSGYLVESPQGSQAEDTARQLGLSHGAAKVALHRLRTRFGERLRREVADTVDDPKDIDMELRALIAALGQL